MYDLRFYFVTGVWILWSFNHSTVYTELRFPRCARPAMVFKEKGPDSSRSPQTSQLTTYKYCFRAEIFLWSTLDQEFYQQFTKQADDFSCFSSKSGLFFIRLQRHVLTRFMFMKNRLWAPVFVWKDNSGQRKQQAAVLLVSNHRLLVVETILLRLHVL